jgi:uncharacterized membrane protein YeaQ/YmgE (transglycosylase-associated protein family)
MTLTLSGLIALLIIAAICGVIGKSLGGGARGGLLVSIVLGFIGALLGPWFARQLRLPEPLMLDIGGYPFPVLWSIIGAALFVALLHLISGSRLRRS